MKIKKALSMFIILLCVTSVFSAIGYEHFTVQENQVYIDLLVKLSKEFKAVEGILETTERNYLNYRRPINGLLNSYLTKVYLNNILIYNEKNEIVSAATGYTVQGATLQVNDVTAFFIPVKTNHSYTPIIHISKPVKDKTNWTIGKILMSLDPIALGRMIDSIIAGYDIDIVVTDKSGTIIYDSDSSEIGRNTLTDPLYQNFPELLKLFEQRITVEKRGEGSYTFLASGMGAAKEKFVMWNTIEAFGTEIKVCMITK